MKKLLLIFTLLSLLTACGGKGFGKAAVIDNCPNLMSEAECAVLKIANYVKYNEGKVPPLSLFAKAGIINVDEINKDSILKLITQKDFDTVNSKAELQILIDKYNTAIDKVKTFAKGDGNVPVPTVEDYADIGIKDIAPKMEVLHIKLKELAINNINELEKISLIKILDILKGI